MGTLFSVVFNGWRDAVDALADQLRRAAAAVVSEHVSSVLGDAQAAVTDVESAMRYGLTDSKRPDAVEAMLFAELLRRERLVEVSFTYALAEGYDDSDDLRLAAAGRGRVSVIREPNGALRTRHVRKVDGNWVVDIRPRATHGVLESVPFMRSPETPPDPTLTVTFRTPANRNWRDQALWSDLSYFSEDEALPEVARRKVLTVQKAIFDGTGTFAGVLRAGLLSDEIDRISQQSVTGDPDDPHHAFLCDRAGRLITRLSSADRFFIDETDDALRVRPAALPPVLTLALGNPALDQASADKPIVARADGQLVTITQLRDDRTQGWLVGVMVPERHYLGGLIETRTRLFAIAALLGVLVVVGALLSMRAIRRGLGQIVLETGRMRSFEFEPSPVHSTFIEVHDALGSLEIAKTALRAMGRYVPIELVRLLYRAGREPVLGGEPTVISLLFCDIRGFTSFSETLPPDELATALGAHLAVVTRAIQATGGTVDKFIGDAVMAMWNAPLATPDHARRACQAALNAQRALEELYASSDWAGREPWITRFGLHHDRVLVGHFGAPDRLAFTAIGDGVNVASRIEGLNKQYGTTLLVSETIVAECGDAFVFRRIDRVAVKGKSQPIELFELLGPSGTPKPRAAIQYERAFAIYLTGEFVAAAEELEQQLDDAPSQALAARCRELAAAPPPNWDGVFRATEK